jgi:serine/threonine protein kinase
VKDTSSATERVGRYQLLEPIGGGPNGSVSRAKVFGVAGFERQFAVKRFLPELTVGAAAQALSQAARAYGSLEHPRIARMSEFGVAQGQTFTAVELVTGLDVFRLMQESKLAGVAIPPGGALALVSQAARAVGYAHGRGLSHLGLAPTNVIVTVDGDVKVTDFGILAATMPPNPVEATRLAHRIPYLAPEQLAGEATSAATDVFVLGVLAYELVTGQRAYRGDAPAQIAQAILAGPPAEPPLPRPIVRVLQRCLARSPFERFPDARALADALDAAHRVAPVPGTRKDIGVQIKATLDRYATLNEGNLSGMVALNFGTPPVADTQPQPETTPFTRPEPPALQRPEARTEPSPMPVVPPVLKPTTTIPGLVVPPPIPGPPHPPPPSGSAPQPSTTWLGLQVKKPSIPTIPSITKKAPTTPPPPPLAEKDEVVDAPSGLLEVDDSGPIRVPHVPLSDDGTLPPLDPTSNALHRFDTNAETNVPATQVRLPKPTPGQNFESQTGEMSKGMLEQLQRKATMATSDIAPLAPPPEAPPPKPAPTEEEPVTLVKPAEPSPSSTRPGHSPARPSTPPPVLTPAPAPVTPPSAASSSSQLPSSGLPKLALGVLLLGVLGAGGYYLYTTQLAPKQAQQVVATKSIDAGMKETVAPPTLVPDAAEKAATVTADAAAEQVATVPVDATAKVATAPVDATAPPADAAEQVATTTPTPAGSSDSLEINSKPRGARVFIDGADQGTTPVKLAGSTDRHTLAVLLPGHDLYIAEVDGHGVFNVALKPVTPSGGQAGIKVLKCKDKERYYVYVDGAATGMTCPTERIDTVVGPHTVEVYDIVTESRRKFEINVKDERLSERVRIEQ